MSGRSAGPERPRAGAPTTAGGVRDLRGEAEWEAHTVLGVREFQRAVAEADVQSVARRFAGQLLQGPERVVSRGIVVHGRVIAGYTAWYRAMRVGAARARTACIGNVVVAPDERGRGLGRRLMEDAIAEARRLRCAVILLQGIANFYRPFGFVDVFDTQAHAVAVADVLALRPGPGRVRPAAAADAAALARLYRRHFGDACTGAFERPHALAAHRTRAAAENGGGIDVAADPRGIVRGYLVRVRQDPHIVREVAADDAASAWALARFHAAMVAAMSPAPEEIVWQMPRDSLALALLEDGARVRSQGERVPNAGWMARPADPRVLARVVEGAAPPGAVPLDLEVDGLPCRIGPPGAVERPHAALAGATWLALAFRHRPAAWAATQRGADVPRAALAALEASLPRRPGWIAGSDRF